MKTILIIVVIFVIFLVSSGMVEGFVKNNTGGDYRLGDIVKSQKFREQLKTNCLKKYPESIATKYIKRTNKDNDIRVLIDIIDKYPNKTPKDAIIVHLRIGDVIKK